MVYYNEFDPKAAAWLRELGREGHIPAGDVDERSIEDVRPDELLGYRHAHFFAGIGGWAYALRLAGWPDEWPVWTGSCPCQPYSSAGSRKGDDDPRALWWAWRWLIDQCRPQLVFGEQVASKAGREWLAGVRADLESMGYAVGAADLPAAGVGAPHIRQRLFWVAYAVERRRQESRSEGESLDIADEDSAFCSPWGDYVWIPCADGKARRIKPGLELMVDGIPGRVALLRGAGNAIVPQVAAVFIRAYMDAVFRA